MGRYLDMEGKVPKVGMVHKYIDNSLDQIFLEVEKLVVDHFLVELVRLEELVLDLMEELLELLEELLLVEQPLDFLLVAVDIRYCIRMERTSTKSYMADMACKERIH
jgi:hypothetical protein